MSIHQQYIVPESESIIECMRRLDEAPHKVLFVVDERQSLIGSLTDGDIRRWILAHGSLSTTVRHVANLSPSFVPAGSSSSHVVDTMRERQVDALPLVDPKRRVVSIVFSAELDQVTGVTRPAPARLRVPVVIMAGGQGTRLQPLTTILPKPLIPIGDRSIVEHIIDRFREQGAESFHLSVGHRARLVRAYFEDRQPDYDLNVVEETVPLGTAGALHLIRDKLPETFLVSNCDVLVSADYGDFLAFHANGNHLISLIAAVRHFRVPYGVCDFDRGGRLITIREKPEHQYLISTGVYAVQREVLDLVAPGQRVDMTDLISAVQTLGRTVGVYPVSEGSWSDIGEWPEYHKTLTRFVDHGGTPSAP